MGTVAEYQNEFEMLIKRVTIPESLLKSFYISGLKLALQRLILQLWEKLSSEPVSPRLVLRTVVDANVGDQEEPQVKDKQVKKADDQEIENIQDEEGKNVEDQQVSEADDDTNIDDFGCSLSHHKGDDLTVEKVVLENIKSDLEEDEDEQDSNPNGVFNDVSGVGYSKADGTWVPARIIEDG
ncbi:hypothetical protein Tco_0340001 [Tanacetum coccineum]